MTQTTDTAGGLAPRRKLVLCEDDQATREVLSKLLEMEDFEVLEAPTTTDALRHCEHAKPDLLVLDLSQPDKSGLSTLREIRDPHQNARFDRQLGIVVASGLGTERDRVRALEIGADDYVVKPFPLGELLDRLDHVLRRRGTDDGNVINVEGLAIDRARRTAWVDDTQVHVQLSDKEFALLVMLANEPTRVFGREELLRDVFGYRSLSHAPMLEALGDRLRKKLDPTNERYVRTTFGVGFRLVEPR